MPLAARDAKTFWDYEPAMPSGKYRHLEVGFTKMMLGERGIHLKLETLNPTRSFKDRGSVIEVAKAAEYDYDEVVCASTGNMAYSIAYYAKLYGLRAKVFISKDANKDKVRDIRETHDADVTHVDGDFNKAQLLAEHYARGRGAFLSGDYCYRKEGQRTIAYEIMQQLPDAQRVVIPVGNATLLSGMAAAFGEMLDAGSMRKAPELVGVEAKKCAPLFKAFSSGMAVKYERPKTAADAIAVGYPTFGDHVLPLLRKLGGRIVAVGEAEMRHEQARFYKMHGLAIELAAAAALAAAAHLSQRDKKTVVVITGGNV